MKLFLFNFGDRPYGGRFIAITSESREAALDQAIDATLGRTQGWYRQKHEPDFRRWAELHTDSANGIDIAEGAWVDGSYEE